MKIFFLEERLANGNQNSNVDLINANAELKVIKYLNCSLQIDFWTLLNDFLNDFNWHNWHLLLTLPDDKMISKYFKYFSRSKMEV